MALVVCVNCGQAYPQQGTPYCCPACGGIFDWVGDFSTSQGGWRADQPGLWRYRSAFGLPDDAPAISLGEGNTPLIELGGGVYGKMESLNPTGSYKDRGSSTLVGFLRARGVTAAVEDSSGNAGASFAAYAARAGLLARVFVPEAASGPKRLQIEAYGASLVRVPGPRSNAAHAVLAEVRNGAVYASHAFMPFGLPGIATIAYELVEQLGRVPGTVIAPVGHGGLLLGIVRGFQALRVGGMITELPYFVGVQAGPCAPVAAAYQAGRTVTQELPEGTTIAEGVRVSQPVRANALLQAFAAGGGAFVAIPEEGILPAYQTLARRGIHVEPTAALAWAAYELLREGVKLPVALIFSGTGLKYIPQT